MRCRMNTGSGSPWREVAEALGIIEATPQLILRAVTELRTERERAAALYLAERESCAKIAEEVTADCRELYRRSGGAYYLGATDSADRIAAKIRSGQ